MKIKISTVLLIAVVLSYILISCMPSDMQSADEILRELSIDSKSVKSLSTCELMDKYAEVGSHFVDRGHSIVLMPIWVDEAIDSRPSVDIANCIVQKGNSVLERLSQGVESEKELSLQIHALVYKAYNNNLFVYPMAKEFLDNAVCNFDVYYSYELTVIDYVITFRELPSYINDDGVEERMLSEICM